MFTKQNKEQESKKKQIVYALLAGAACVTVGTLGYNNMPESVGLGMTSMATKSDLNTQFHMQLADQCNEWYADSSKSFAASAKTLKPQVEFIHDYKGLMGRYAPAEFRSVKNDMIDLVDGLTDAQRDIVSTNKYQDKQLGFMTKRSSELAWKFQLKYSTRVSDKCYVDSDRLQEWHTILDVSDKTMRKDLNALSAGFADKAAEDLAAWDCVAMYPKPVRTTMNWFELVSGAAKQGFEVFNKVKGMLPEGAMKGMKIPGMPAGIPGAGAGAEMFELEDFEEELTMLKIFGGDTAATWAERQRIHAEALAMCHEEHGLFEDSINKIQENASVIATRRAFKSFNEYPISEVETSTYKTTVMADSNGDMSATEHDSSVTMQHSTHEAFKETLELANKNMEAALKIKAKLME